MTRRHMTNGHRWVPNGSLNATEFKGHLGNTDFKGTVGIDLQTPPAETILPTARRFRGRLILLVGIGLGLVALVAGWLAAAKDSPQPLQAETQSVLYPDLRIGDCFNGDAPDVAAYVSVVPCETAHQFEVYAVFDLDPSLDGPEEEATAAEQCSELRAAKTAGAASPRTYPPSGEFWPDDYREVICYLDHGAKVTGSSRVSVHGPLLRGQIAEVMAAVEKLRGLAFPSVPEIQIVSEEELAAVSTEDYDSGLGEVVDPVVLLFSPRDAIITAGDLGELTLGLYDPNTGIIVMPAANQFDPWQEAILAHEMTHALTDGHFRFQSLGELDYDEAAALDAVIEGDATRIEERYVYEHLTASERAAWEEVVYGDGTAGEWTAYDTATYFTYVIGYEMVTSLYESGGQQAVDDAYHNPPRSTEHVLFSVPGEGDPPLVVASPDSDLVETLDTYDLIDWGSWGVLRWWQLLGGYEDMVPALAGWGGARFALYSDEDGHYAIAIRHLGDDVSSTRRLFEALTSYLPRAMNVGGATINGSGLTAAGDDYLWIRRSGAELLLVAAQDPEAGPLFAEALGRPEDP